MGSGSCRTLAARTSASCSRSAASRRVSPRATSPSGRPGLFAMPIRTRERTGVSVASASSVAAAHRPWPAAVTR
ncbi:hypothetical protein ACFQZ4_03710 [Catellatospora coxensis]